MRFLTLSISILSLLLSITATSEDISISEVYSYNNNYLKPILQEHFSFYPLFSTDIDQKLDALDSYNLPGEMIPYRLELQKILASYNESHSGVVDLFNTTQSPHKSSVYDQKIGILKVIPEKHPRFVLLSTCEFKSGQGNSFIEQNLFDSEHPYLIAIDTIPIAYWVHQLEPYIASRNPARIYQQSRYWLEHINQARKMTGKTLSNKARLTLASEDGSTIDHFVPLREDIHTCPKDSSHHVHFVDIQPDSETVTAAIDGDIAYVPLPEMYNIADNDNASKLFMLMEQLRSASGKKGMILDLRDNHKGNRTAMVALYPFLVDPMSLPKVANIMSYRLPADESEPWGNSDSDKLAHRFTFSANHPIWSEKERLTIEAFEMIDFRGDISHISKTPRDNWFEGKSFSRWHYMVMSPQQQFFRNMVREFDVRTADDAFIIDNFSDLINRLDDILPHYTRPEQIVVLTNQGTFNAAEILAGTLKGMDGITLMGSRSSGGSSIPQTYTLPCGTEIKLGTTLSFAPDGKAYDNIGILPDQVVLPAADDFVFRQRLNTNRPQVVHVTDNLLKQAIRFIKTSQSITRSLEAGSIYGDDDAQEKCPILCETNDGLWNQQWTSVIPGEMAVCQCLLPREPLETIEDPIFKAKLPQNWLGTTRTTAKLNRHSAN